MKFNCRSLMVAVSALSVIGAGFAEGVSPPPPPKEQGNAPFSQLVVVYKLFQSRLIPSFTEDFDASVLRPRQACPTGEQACGVACIPTDFTCCDGLSGGCAPNFYCDLTVEGCCANGQVCGGRSQECATLDQQVCGDRCISRLGTCCPGEQIGCAAGSYCYLQDSSNSNSTYGCCRNGTTCSNDAGGDNGDQCGSGEQSCGDGCIRATSTCCPDGQSGCPAGSFCYPSNDGGYSCCANGDTCGNATSIFNGSKFTSASASSSRSSATTIRVSTTSTTSTTTTRSNVLSPPSAPAIVNGQPSAPSTPSGSGTGTGATAQSTSYGTRAICSSNSVMTYCIIGILCLLKFL